MLFNSFTFLLFFPFVFIVYLIIPKKFRNIWILTTSYFFYMSYNPKYVILLFLSTISTYFAGLFIGISGGSGTKKKRLILVSVVSLNLAILCVFKYNKFLLHSINIIQNWIGVKETDVIFHLMLPVGISFYTFQVIGYLLDVYRGEITAERNFIDYAMFVSFFPQLVAGPIERSKNLLHQIKNTQKINPINKENVRIGVIYIIWGYFLKLVIADRIAIYVNAVYDNYTCYGLLEILIAVILFAFQIYGDFHGYTMIAKGCALLLGFDLMDNFEQPYFALNVRDFWKRWHISLTTWFTDYIYIPLGGNRKGKTRKYFNILIVFFLSGLWHGAGWNYIIWGLLNGIYMVISYVKLDFLKEKEIECKGYWIDWGRRVITFMLICSTWLFFSAGSVSKAVDLIKQCFVKLYGSHIYDVGLGGSNFTILIISFTILFVVEYMKERKKDVLQLVADRTSLLHIIFYVIAIWYIIMFGVYGVGYNVNEFIYFRF